MKDFYNILGVNQKSSQDDIKKAYKKLVLKHHPDKGGDGETIKAINEAYDTLKDQTKRQNYDLQKNNPFGFSSRSSGKPFGSFDINLNDLFRSHFNFDNKGPNAFYYHDISLVEAFHGKKDVARLENGQMLDFNIPAGIEHGASFRFKGMNSRKQFADQIPGDVIIKISIMPNSTFGRNKAQLYKHIDINAIDCILGIDKIVNTIDNKSVKVTIPPGTQNGTKFKIPNYGMPFLGNPKKRGDFIIQVNVVVPNISDQEKLDKLRGINGIN